MPSQSLRASLIGLVATLLVACSVSPEVIDQAKPLSAKAQEARQFEAAARSASSARPCPSSIQSLERNRGRCIVRLGYWRVDVTFWYGR